MEKVNERLGRKITAVIGAIVGLVGCLWLRYGCAPGDPYVQYHIFFVAILLGKFCFSKYTFLIFPITYISEAVLVGQLYFYLQNLFDLQKF